MASDRLETLTQRIGHAIFAAAREDDRAGGDGFLTGEWLDRQMMRFTTRDEMLKAQLFRFVDVLPMLRTDEQVNAHLREYLGDVRDRLPLPLAKAMDWWP